MGFFKNQSKVEAKAESIQKSSPRLRIFLIEDDTETREIVQEILEGLDHTVVPFKDGLDAWAHMKTFPNDVPDAVWLDLVMPNLSGSELLARMPVAKEWAKVRVAVCSANKYVNSFPIVRPNMTLLPKPMHLEEIEKLFS